MFSTARPVAALNNSRRSSLVSAQQLDCISIGRLGHRDDIAVLLMYFDPVVGDSCDGQGAVRCAPLGMGANKQSKTRRLITCLAPRWFTTAAV